jgi:hypothetical protein
MHPAGLCGGFRTIFFFCLVGGPLEKKKLTSVTAVEQLSRLGSSGKNGTAKIFNHRRYSKPKTL